jgi:hypothetical protein
MTNNGDLIVMSTTTAPAVVDRDEDFDEFHRDFEKHFRDLTTAIGKSRAVSSDAQKVHQKSSWGMFWGGLSGDNDKQFAEMAKDLASSLTTTQVVLQMVMRLNHRKNNFLSRFHNALVTKIRNLANDSKTLDDNQKEATLVILEELDRHVLAQIEQQELVYRHEVKLETLDKQVADTEARAEAAAAHLSDLESTIQQLARENIELHGLTDSYRARIVELGVRLQGQTEWQRDFDVSIAELNAVCARNGERIRSLEHVLTRMTSAKVTLLRIGLSVVALVFSAVALIKAFT